MKSGQLGTEKKCDTIRVWILLINEWNHIFRKLITISERYVIKLRRCLARCLGPQAHGDLMTKGRN